LGNSTFKCQTCGKSFTAPAGQASDELVEEESARCARLREIAQQRQALSLKLQAGIVGMLGSDTVDTIDLVAHRRSLAQLDATLAAQAKELEAAMLHKPDGL
jgi:hypothetical protein